MTSPRFEENPTHWDARFFALARLVSTWSEDKSRQVGAVIVGPSKEVRSLGFNGLARGVSNDQPERHIQSTQEKYYWFEHAERNAVYNAARSGVTTLDCEVYCTLFPCSDCLRALIQSGISKLKTFEPPKEDVFFARSFEVAVEMASEAGLEIVYFDDSVYELSAKSAAP